MDNLITAARAARTALSVAHGALLECSPCAAPECQQTQQEWLDEARRAVEQAAADLRTALAAAEAQPVAYRLDYPPEAGIGLPRFYGADDEARMRNHLECVLAAVTPLYESPAAPPQVPQPKEESHPTPTSGGSDRLARAAHGVSNEKGTEPSHVAASVTQPAEPFGYVITNNFPDGHQYRHTFFLPSQIGTAYKDNALSITKVYAAPPQVPQPLSDEQIAALVLATVYEGDSSTPYRDAWTTEIGIPFARAIEAAHGIGAKP